MTQETNYNIYKKDALDWINTHIEGIENLNAPHALKVYKFIKEAIQKCD